MISVLPCRDKTKIQEFFKNHNLVTDEFSSCVIASSNNEVLGYCLFSLSKEKMTVFAVEPQNDIPLADGILRSALHVSAENFVLDAFYADRAPVELFYKLDFVKILKKSALILINFSAGVTAIIKIKKTLAKCSTLWYDYFC